MVQKPMSAKSTRQAAGVGLLLIGISVSPFLAQIPKPIPSFSVDVDLVELHVTVSDSRGRSLSGLAQEHFRITEDDTHQAIALFKHEDIPVSLGLVVDNSRSIEPYKERLDAAAVAFLAKSNPDDESTLIHFDFNARVSLDFTRDHRALESALKDARPYGQTALYDAFILALDRMEKAQYSKKALLVITDGVDNASKATLQQALDRVKASDVLVFAVGLLNDSGALKVEESLSQLATASGGTAYFPETPEEARSMMERIARDIREQYTIAYRPTNAMRDGKWRSVRVQVVPPKNFPKDLDVSYRHGYYAPGSTQ
jgi:VWFA-related protein